MTLALLAPDLASDMILIAPAGFETFTEKDRAFFRQLVTPAAIAATPVDRIRTNFAVNFHQMQFPENAEFMFEDRLLLRADSVAYQAYCQMIPKCVEAMLAAPVFDRLPEIQQRIQVIYGKGDLLIPNKILHPALTVEKVAEAGIKALPSAKLELIESCGHFVQWECAAEVATIIKKYLR
jgi:pimeloyl-ACP methyl ester carboxylesterase